MLDILDSLFDGNKPHKDQTDLPEEKSILDGHDTLRALMTYELWKGEPREKATLSLFHANGEWVCRLIDVDNRRSFASGGRDLADAIASMEAVLVTNKPNWYYWPKANGYRKPKKSAT